MAKIDVSTIEGFADMTAEQKAEALANYEFPDPDYTGYVKKDVLTRLLPSLRLGRRSTMSCFLRKNARSWKMSRCSRK